MTYTVDASAKLFNGKMYRLRGMPGYKVDAKKLKENLQRRGHSVRITRHHRIKGIG